MIEYAEKILNDSLILLTRTGYRAEAADWLCRSPGHEHLFIRVFCGIYSLQVPHVEHASSSPSGPISHYGHFTRAWIT